MQARYQVVYNNEVCLALPAYVRNALTHRLEPAKPVLYNQDNQPVYKTAPFDAAQAGRSLIGACEHAVMHCVLAQQIDPEECLMVVPCVANMLIR